MLLTWELTLNIICLAVVAFGSANVLRIYTRTKERNANDFQLNFPEGACNVESAEESRPSRNHQHVGSWQCSSIFIFASLALVLKFTQATLRRPSGEDWISTASWVFTFFQALALLREHVQKRLYNIGLWMCFSGLAVCVAEAVEFFLRLKDPSPDILTTLAAVRLASGVCLSLIALCIPRRENIYFRGYVVDGQWACSLVSRLSFSWVESLLDLARFQQTLEYSDLPALDRKTRSENLKNSFSNTQKSHDIRQETLWRSIFRKHYPTFFRQWSLGVLESILIMLPPVSLYKILALMEIRSSAAEPIDLQLGLWITVLTVTKLAHTFVSVWTEFTAFAVSALRVRSLLNGVIFDKSLRTKIIAEGSGSLSEYRNSAKSRTETATAVAESTEANGESTPLLTGSVTTEEISPVTESRTNAAEASRGIPTLIAADARRVEVFCAYSVHICQGVIQICLATAFLVSLLGWPSTLAGLAIPLLVYPLNRLAIVRYVEIQEIVMKIKDRKEHIISEALNAIRQIKFSASEASWERSILAIRKEEFDAGWTANLWMVFVICTWMSMPAVIGAVALTVYALSHVRMTASIVFTALSVFASLETTIGVFPMALGTFINALVSARRIEEHLNSEERLESLEKGECIKFHDAQVAWPSRQSAEPRIVLSNVTLQFPPGKISLIHGNTGSGKSLLLAAIIGEAQVVRGKLTIPRLASSNVLDNDWVNFGAMAFVAQVPWLENASLRDNILFGNTYDHVRYTKVLHACALVPDLRILQDGDQTEIGASGLNLSGGQKWRVTFARALYSRAEILVLDDIFSAVDAHVGRHLLEQAILGELARGRTIIMATHHVGLVESYAECVIHIRDGRAVDATRTNTLSEGRGSSASTTESQIPTLTGDIPAEKQTAIPKKFVQDEDRKRGRVPLSTYRSYLAASGGLLYWSGIFVLLILAATLTLGRTYWVKIWTSQYDQAEDRAENSDQSHGPGWRTYLGVYGALSLLSVALLCFQTWTVSIAALRAASHMFQTATHNVLRARMRWLDTQPLGRILNRFVGDFLVLDTRVGIDIAWTFTLIFSALTAIASALFVSLWMAIPVTVVTLTCTYVTYLYLDAARDLRRLESTAKSPIFDLVTSTLSGLATIRCFGRVDEYMDKMHERIDRHARTTWYIAVAIAWMQLRQGVLGALLALSVAVAVVRLDNITAPLAGFALTFALQYSAVIERVIRQYTDTELDMNCAERVLEYSELETEPANGAVPPAVWPSQGRVEFQNVEVGYAPDLPSVLNDISFEVAPSQRIGIVGRTGSGKSSLTLALFRFLELRKGTIRIDDMDISTIKLEHLRSRMTIIPQDPVLFSGTLRTNLDPFDDYEDADLLQALRRVHLLPSALDEQQQHTNRQLASTSTSTFTNLDSPVSSSGTNLSQGQKQLLCLARALLTRPKILVLDEATSAVDAPTDALIQSTIRGAFRDTTLLVIAHRLSTVRDFDRLLVLDEGRIVEFDEPARLMEMEDGVFRGMWLRSAK